MPRYHDHWPDPPQLTDQPAAPVTGTCYACPDHPDGHPFTGDYDQHLADAGERLYPPPATA